MTRRRNGRDRRTSRGRAPVMSSTQAAPTRSVSPRRPPNRCWPPAASSGSTCTSRRQDDFAVLRDVFEFHPARARGLGALRPAGEARRLRRLRLPGRLRRRARRGPAGRGALLLLRALPRSPSTGTRRPPSPRCGIATRSATAPIDDPALLLYRIIDALVDSFFPILADFDDRIDELENQTFLHAERRSSCRRSSR